MFDLPEPFGPTIAVIPLANSKTVRDVCILAVRAILDEEACLIFDFQFSIYDFLRPERSRTLLFLVRRSRRTS